MIRALKTRDWSGNCYTIDFADDNKSEITNNMNLQSLGLPMEAAIRLGSTVITAEEDCAIRNSSGEWVWQDD